MKNEPKNQQSHLNHRLIITKIDMKILNLLLDLDTKKKIRDHFFDMIRLPHLRVMRKFLQFHIHQSKPPSRRVSFINSNRHLQPTLHLHLQQVHLQQQTRHLLQTRKRRLNFSNRLHTTLFHLNQSDQLHLSNDNQCQPALRIHQSTLRINQCQALHILHTREHSTHIHVQLHFHFQQSPFRHLRGMQKKLKT